MTNPTVSVELTEAQIQCLTNAAHQHRWSCPYGNPCNVLGVLYAAQRQFADRDREAKVQALKDNVAIPPGYDHWVALDCLNNAGWDLVRMEEKKPYSEWEVRDMMNAAYRSEEK
jgi:hypothetical protein